MLEMASLGSKVLQIRSVEFAGKYKVKTRVLSSLTPPDMPLAEWADFTSGYIRRSAHLFPKRGMKAPWLLKQNYIHDLVTLRHGKVDDGAMVFSNPVVPGPQALAAAE